MELPGMSVVHDYAILYSNRITQKDKRWTDGRLRFYELNSKIEVYSEEQFLVASDFYPSSKKLPLETGAFEEGTEYTLPSGKLVVSFQEYLGCSVRDVSKIFKKASTRNRDSNEASTNAAFVKSETPVKLEDVRFTGSFVEGSVPMPEELRALTTEPKVSSSIAPTPSKRRVGLSKTRSTRKKQSDLMSFSSGPSVSDRLRMYAPGRLPKIRRIYPRSSNLYRRLYKELAVGETVESDSLIKVPHTGLTQVKQEFSH